MADAASSGLPASDKSDAVAAKIGPGRLVLVVGPSGAGKDTLLRLARDELQNRPDVVFPARVVTRLSDSNEANQFVTPATFQSELAWGAFALHWTAHGKAYGISAAIEKVMRSGKSVVVNGSRDAVAEARRRFQNVRVVLVDAPLELRAERLAGRKREAADEIAARLKRDVAGFTPADADAVIQNDGTPEAGALELARLCK